jgi:hypothetical protein
MKTLGSIIKYCWIIITTAGVSIWISAFWLWPVKEAEIPTTFEIQQQLVDLGYDIEVDGIIGEKTLEAWQEAVMQRYMKDWDKRMKASVK